MTLMTLGAIVIVVGFFSGDPWLGCVLGAVGGILSVMGATEVGWL